MEKRIIYKTDEGGVAIISPVLDCGLTIEQIALKDVPYGKAFKIIDFSDLPSDMSLSHAWTVDDKDLTDGVGADYGIGSDNPFVMPESAL
jgi:hypothetical protein